MKTLIKVQQTRGVFISRRVLRKAVKNGRIYRLISQLYFTFLNKNKMSQLNTLFWRKVTAVIGIFAIINSMLVSVPFTAYAAAAAINGAQYQADNGHGNSVVGIVFDDDLTSDGSVACGGLPATVCFDPADIDLTDGSGTEIAETDDSSDNAGWASGIYDEDIIGVMRGEGAEQNQIQIVFNTTNVVDSTTLTGVKVAGFGGITGTLTHTDLTGNPAPSANSAEYTDDLGNGKSRISLFFTTGVDDTDGTSACTSDAGKKCVPTNSVEIPNATNDDVAGGVNIEEIMIDPDGDDSDEIAIIFDAINGLTDYSTAAVTYKSGTAGVTSDQTFNSISLVGGGGPAPISNVTSADHDTEGPGLDGRDFAVSWTNGTEPTGYVSTRVFIVPNTTASGLTTSNIDTNGCGGSACGDMMMFNDFDINIAILPQFISNDSEMNPFSGGTTYQACVLIDADTDTLECSSDLSLTDDNVTDTDAPFVDHISVHTAVESVDAVINAAIFDEQTTHANFANTGDSEAEFFQLKYRDQDPSSYTTLNAVQVEGSLFQFTVPGASVPAAGGTFEYYLAAKDRTGNTTYMCNAGVVGSEYSCQSAPFTVNTVAAGTRTISGTVSTSEGAVANAKVIAAGFAGAAVTADGSGNYTLSNIPGGNAYDIMAFKSGHCHNGRFEILDGVNLSSINITINDFECSFGGGSMGEVHVIHANPVEGAFNVNTDNRKLFATFNQNLNIASVNDSNAADSGSNVFLTTDDGTTKIAGSVVFCEDYSTSGCNAHIQSTETNTLVFIPSGNLSTNTTYTLVITEAVIGDNGQPISGNTPGIGHLISFSTGGGALNTTDITNNFGASGQYMPPYVRAMIPGPGNSAAVDQKIVLEFNEGIDATSLSGGVLLKNSADTAVTNTATQSADGKFVIVTPSSSLAQGEYTVEVLGQVANANGVTMRPSTASSEVAFSSSFQVTSKTPAAPTVYPYLTNNATDVAVNQVFEFGLDGGSLDPTTVTSSNVTLTRGGTTVAANVEYDVSQNLIRVVPVSVLAPNTTYSISFSSSVVDLRSQTLGAGPYTYTTGSTDSTAPELLDARCDDFVCTIRFSEPMNHALQSGSGYASSVLNHANITLTNGGSDLVDSTVIIAYDSFENAARIEGLNLSVGSTFSLTVESTSKDLSSNGIDTTGSANVMTGIVEDPQETFGDMGDHGMFGPPTADMAGGSIGGGTFMPSDFGAFTVEEFFSGSAVMAFPFNPTAGQDSNVFQIGFTPGVAIQDGDQLEITFPTGTDVTNAVPDDYSPFKDDMNEFFGDGIVTFDTALDTDGVEVNASQRKVTVQFNVSGGSPSANDYFTVDLKGITNPSVPRGFDSSGYKVSMKLKRSSSQIGDTLESMPFFIQEGGSNDITVNVYAGSQGSPDNVSGNVFLFAGGPIGAMDKDVTLTNGVISAVDGVSASNIAYTSLNDGCYFIGTDPYMELSSTPYRGADFPEPICVEGGQSVTHNIVLTSESSLNGATVNVKLAGISNFQGKDIDIFAGGPNGFTVKTLTNVGVPDSNGYDIKLTGDGLWFVGVGPAMPKGASAATTIMEQLPGVPPAPISLRVSDVATTPSVEAGAGGPGFGASFDNATDTVTFTFAAADKAVSGTIQDGSNNPLKNVSVGIHGGFGMGTYTETDSNGEFTLNVSNYGAYEIEAWKPGMPPVFGHLEIRPDGADAGSADDVFYKGTQITGSNPLVLKMDKADYYISGKVLDKDGNGIAYAPIDAENATGDSFVHGNTDSSGNYTIYVDPGTWTLRAQLPPKESSECGTFSKQVIITNESKSSQNIESSESSCYTLSGTITVGGSAAENVPVMVEEWDSGNSEPVFGGVFKPTGTDSSGGYSVEVAGSKTYRISVWDPTYGELSTTKSVTTTDTTANITSGSASSMTFNFTGGEASMSGFLELENTSTGTKKLESLDDLSASHTISALSGTYNYRLNVFGIGDFDGTISAGDTETIDLSTITDFIEISGNVQDDNANNLVNATVTATGVGANAGIVRTTKTDASGNYSLDVKDGDWQVSVGLANYVAPAVSTTTFAADTSGTNIVMESAGQSIQGTIYASDASTAMKKAKVMATNSATGAVIVGDVDPTDGTYSLPVVDGTWVVKAAGPLHAKTTGSTVVVSGGDQTGQNITLTADNTKVAKSASKAVSANIGGTVDDTSNSGIKLTTGSGVLETGSGDVTVSLEKNYTAPDTANYTPLGNTAFEITAEGSQPITQLNGNAAIQFDYSTLVSSIPSGSSESDLQLVYLDDSTGEYVPVEGGFTIDTDNNTATGYVDHFTTFSLVLSNANITTPSSSSGVAGARGSSSKKTLIAEESAAVDGSTDAAEGETSEDGAEGDASAEELEEDAVTPENPTYEEVNEDDNTITYFIPPKGTHEVVMEDIDTHWAQNIIKDLTSRGIVDSYEIEEGGLEFKPDQGMTRAELVKAIVRAKELPVPLNVTAPELGFYDVSARSEFAPYIYAAKEAGLIDAGLLFRPHATVNRAEALKIILLGAETDLEDYPEGMTLSFEDVARDAWFRPYLKYAFHKGIIGGYEVAGKREFRGANNVTRAEASKIIAKVFDFDAKDAEKNTIAEVIKASLFGLWR